VNVSGSLANNGNNSVSAVVSGSDVTGTLSASKSVRKPSGNAPGWSCG
jgi:hypothetical protein